MLTILNILLAEMSFNLYGDVVKYQIVKPVKLLPAFALILWILPVAGILLLIDNPAWVYFGLVGGGIYLYFSGRLLIVRQLMLRHDIPIGKPETVKLYTAVLILWGLIAVVTLGLALAAITSS